MQTENTAGATAPDLAPEAPAELGAFAHFVNPTKAAAKDGRSDERQTGTSDKGYTVNRFEWADHPLFDTRAAIGGGGLTGACTPRLLASAAEMLRRRGEYGAARGMLRWVRARVLASWPAGDPKNDFLEALDAADAVFGLEQVAAELRAAAPRCGKEQEAGVVVRALFGDAAAQARRLHGFAVWSALEAT